MTVFETWKPEETYELGKKMGEEAVPGQVICLNGPTFTIVQQYGEGRLPLYHFDVYRIGDISEMDEIGYEDCFFGDGVCLIEWSGLIEEILPEHVTKVAIEKNLEHGFDYRRISVEET